MTEPRGSDSTHRLVRWGLIVVGVLMVGFWIAALLTPRATPSTQRTILPASKPSPPAVVVPIHSYETDLAIVRAKWTRGGFDAVALWTVTIRNAGPDGYQDLTYRTRYYARSGTERGQHRGVIFDLIAPGQTRTFKVNDGFFPSQSDTATFDLTGATSRPWIR